MKADVAKANAELVHAIERNLKKAIFLLRPFDFDGACQKERTPTGKECEEAWRLLNETLISVERGLRDQLAYPIDVTLPEMGVPPNMRIVPTTPAP